jgi:hypothetical protein
MRQFGFIDRILDMKGVKSHISDYFKHLNNLISLHFDSICLLKIVLISLSSLGIEILTQTQVNNSCYLSFQ